MRRLALVGIAAAAALGVALGAFAGTRASSGVYGVITKSPTKPVCTDGGSCTAPAAGVTVEVAAAQTVVAKTRTARNGAYRIALRPGRYTIKVVGAFRAGTVPITVPHGWVHKDIRYDTGIRGAGSISTG